ncbi:hypothetical protein FHT09_000692 [Xanthomonas arboricola]|nr:hypothetical protein [Xanthomonas sp. CFBP 8152]PPT80304.1 hypothetical protein XarbCFBP8152_06075 [Xanthomonas arboricola]
MSHDTYEAPTSVAYQAVHDVVPIPNALEGTRAAVRSPKAHPDVTGKAVHALTPADADVIATVASAVTGPQR